MKISSETLNILKSYTSINPSIWVQPGTVIKTISPQKTIVATAEVDDVFDSSFGIYDLNQLLSVITLFENPEYVFDDKSVLIKSAASSVEYFYTEKQMITMPPEKDISLPDSIIEFKLPVNVIKSTMQAANVLQLPEWSVIGQDGNISITVSDTKNNTGNVYRSVVGKTDKTFNIVFKVENLKFMHKDYNVNISSKGISHFYTDDNKIQYWIATESR